MMLMEFSAEVGRRKILGGIGGLAILGLGVTATGCTSRQRSAEVEAGESDSSSQYVFGYGSLIQGESREET